MTNAPPLPLKYSSKRSRLVISNRYRLASRLAPSGFEFEGPVDRFDDAGEFVRDLEKYTLILKRIERRRIFVDGREGCAVLTFVTSVSDIERTRVVVWVKTDTNGRIVRIESFLDARAYTRMFEEAALISPNE